MSIGSGIKNNIGFLHYTIECIINVMFLNLPRAIKDREARIKKKNSPGSYTCNGLQNIDPL
jgi:hypothetical protein